MRTDIETQLRRFNGWVNNPDFDEVGLIRLMRTTLEEFSAWNPIEVTDNELDVVIGNEITWEHTFTINGLDREGKALQRTVVHRCLSILDHV